MIIKIHKAGRSFKGVTRYLTHDAKAETTERVAWTHTLNLADDHVPTAVNEMLWTARSADYLKRDAGVSTGGSKLEKPVKHFSLSWPPNETPSKEHMIETVRAYMAHMGWQDRQAVLVAHDDTRHPHVHVVMNSVSPIDGRAAGSSNDWKRSEAFALQYEREHGRIHCEQRLKERQDREATPTRENWQRFKQSEIAFERAEVERLVKTPDYVARHNKTGMNRREWEALKAWQKQERERYFMEGKEAYRAVKNEAFREVREQFRGQWNAYYAAKRHGDDPTALAATKAALLDAQRKALDEQRTKACDELRKQRDRAYEQVLKQQRFDRAELTRRQEQGLRTYQLFDAIYPAPEPAARPVERPADERWQAPPKEKPAGRDMTEAGFDRTVRGLVDPDMRVHQDHRNPPGVVRRGDEAQKTAQPVDGFGRVLTEAEKQSGQAKREPVPVEPTPRGPAEMSEAASEKVRVQKAREMTDQATAKEQAGVASAMRASWNRRRFRGGRD